MVALTTSAPKFFVVSSAACMPTNCWGKYRHVDNGQPIYIGDWVVIDDGGNVLDAGSREHCNASAQEIEGVYVKLVEE